MIAMNKNILGIIKISENGLCNEYIEFVNMNNSFDPQLIAGFFYAINKFIKDFTGEKLTEIKTSNYKLIFKYNNKILVVYIIDNINNNDINSNSERLNCLTIST